MTPVSSGSVSPGGRRETVADGTVRLDLAFDQRAQRFGYIVYRLKAHTNRHLKSSIQRSQISSIRRVGPKQPGLALGVEVD